MLTELKQRTIKVNKRNYTYEELATMFSKLDAEYIVSFLTNLNLRIPRALKVIAFKDALLKPVVETRKELKTVTDLKNYQLSWFRKFTEFQLEELIENDYNYKAVIDNYTSSLWVVLIDYLIQKDISEKEMNKLIKDSSGKYNKTKDIKKFNQELNQISFDIEGELDGVSLDAIRSVLYKSSVIPQIIRLGLKYGINIPKRLKKVELLNLIIEELKRTNKHTQELEQKLRKTNVIFLERYCKDNDIKASTDLKKEEIIEFILKNANSLKGVYVAPELKDVYLHEVTDFEVSKEEKVIEDYLEERIPEQVLELQQKRDELNAKYLQEVNENKKRIDELTKKNEQLASELSELKEQKTELKEDKTDEKYESLQKKTEELASELSELKGKKQESKEEKTDDKYDNLQKQNEQLSIKIDTLTHLMYLKEKQEPKVIVQEKYYETIPRENIKDATPTDTKEDTVEVVPNKGARAFIALGYILVIGAIVFILLTAYLK